MSRWLRERRFVLATGLVVGLPIAVSTVETLVAGAVPLADNALIATRAYDVFSSESPLLGPVSSGYSMVVGRPVFHPGPLLFWLFALPARLPWPEALPLTAGLVNLASVVGVVALARRRGGQALMLATAVAIPLMLAWLPSNSYSEIWNPSVPLLPFLALIFLCWSIACGEYKLLPLAVVITSLAVQSHLSYLVPSVAVLAIGVAGLALSRRSRLLRRPARWWVVGALAIGVICWSAPAIDQATNNPGNAELVYRAIRADEATLGMDSGWRAVVHTVGVVPWWLQNANFGLSRAVDLGRAPGAVATGSAGLILVALVVLTLLAWRRKRPEVAVPGILALALCGAVALVASSTPESSVATLGYSLRWASPAGVWVWLALGWSAAALLGPVTVPAMPRRAPALGLGVVAGIAGVVAAGVDLRDLPYSETTAIADRIDSELPHDRPIVIGVGGPPEAAFMGLNVEAGVLYSLRRDGRDVAAGSAADYLGGRYRPQPGDRVVRIDLGTRPPAGARVLARLHVLDSPEPEAPGPHRNPRRWSTTVSVMR